MKKESGVFAESRVRFGASGVALQWEVLAAAVRQAEVLCKLAFMGKMRSLPQLWAECPSPPQFGTRPTCLPLALSVQSPDSDGKSERFMYLTGIDRINHILFTYLCKDKIKHMSRIVCVSFLTVKMVTKITVWKWSFQYVLWINLIHLNSNTSRRKCDSTPGQRHLKLYAW